MTTSLTTDIQPELLPVIQADRDAAWNYWLIQSSLDPNDGRAIRFRQQLDRGERDHTAFIQSYARHRAATPDAGKETAAVSAARLLLWQYERAPDAIRYAAEMWNALNKALSATPASPIPTSAGDMGKARLALEAIKAVTATTKDAVAGLSRILAITRSAGVDVSYSDLMAKPDVALIVNRPRTEWRHLFECAEACTIPPEGWTCSRAPGHDGPCAASPIPTSVNGAGERIAQIIRQYCQNGVTMEPFGGHVDTADLAADAILALSPALDNTAVEEARRECQAVWRCAVGDITGALDVLKNRWLESRRKHEREAGAVLSGVLDLVWAARDPAAASYSEANSNGVVLIERVRATLAAETEKAR